MVNVEEFLMEKMSSDLPPVDLEDPFCWQAYSYAKVCASFLFFLLFIFFLILCITDLAGGVANVF